MLRIPLRTSFFMAQSPRTFNFKLRRFWINSVSPTQVSNDSARYPDSISPSRLANPSIMHGQITKKSRSVFEHFRCHLASDQRQNITAQNSVAEKFPSRNPLVTHSPQNLSKLTE